MRTDEPAVGEAKHGFPLIYVGREHLEDFPALIQWLRETGHGRDTGFVKLRLLDKDRQDDICVATLLALLKKKFEEVEYDPVQKCNVHSYAPDAQLFFKASMQDDIYEYVKMKCTKEDRDHFVEMATNPASFKNTVKNCCSQVLDEHGLDGLRRHYFDEIRHSATFNWRLEEKLQSGSVANEGQTPIIYGAGIQLDRRQAIKICDKFSLARLKTIVDIVEDKFDGIAYPYVYVGTPHSTFCWRIEDVGLFSINYLFKGSRKLWFGIAPKYFGTIDKIASSFHIDHAHTACGAYLINHKSLVADTNYFKIHHRIPYTVVIQEPGDFIITFPWALHSGFNLDDDGMNLAMASNFVDQEWIDVGLYTPVCGCFPTQVKIDFTRMLREFRPRA